MSITTTEEVENLVDREVEKKFEDFKKSFFSRIRKPAIGIVIAIAALVALAGVYVYIDAAAKVYESRAELARARTEFYESMMDSQKEVLELKNQMINRFNQWADDAERNMLLMQKKLDSIEKYDKRFGKILEKHKKAFDEGGHKHKFPLEDQVNKAPEKEEIVKEPEEIILEEPEPIIEEEPIQLVPPKPAQKSYKIDPRQMEQRIIE